VSIPKRAVPARACEQTACLCQTGRTSEEARIAIVCLDSRIALLEKLRAERNARPDDDPPP
jgi:hypothetical protein